MTTAATDNAVGLHPAACWAIQAGFTAEQVDCTTAVVLKILDDKCRCCPAKSWR